MNDFNNHFETWIGSGKFDRENREIGYIIGFNDNGEQFAAWVQNGRKSKGKFSDFGVRQRSKLFSSQEQAAKWAYSTAKQRLANI